jgi:hypothetical protein
LSLPFVAAVCRCVLSLRFEVAFAAAFYAAPLPATRTIMPAQHDEVPTASSKPGKAKRKDLSIVSRNLLMVAVGVVVFAIVATVVLYGPITYGDEVPNFGIILMLTMPVIAGVAFRVGLDAWLDRE